MINLNGATRRQWRWPRFFLYQYDKLLDIIIVLVFRICTMIVGVIAKISGKAHSIQYRTESFACDWDSWNVRSWINIYVLDGKKKLWIICEACKKETSERTPRIQYLNVRDHLNDGTFSQHQAYSVIMEPSFTKLQSRKSHNRSDRRCMFATWRFCVPPRPKSGVEPQSLGFDLTFLWHHIHLISQMMLSWKCHKVDGPCDTNGEVGTVSIMYRSLANVFLSFSSSHLVHTNFWYLKLPLQSSIPSSYHWNQS